MTLSPLQVVVDALERHGSRVTRSGADQVDATCPAHDDQTPSLSVRYDRTGGKVLVNCHTGCSPDDVIVALGLTWTDLFDPKPEQDRTRRPEIVATYDYADEDGVVVFQKVRMFPKDFRVRRPDGRGGWTWRIGDAPRVLYRLPELRAAVAAGKPVLVVEGEKDADRVAEQLGLAATCNYEGAASDGQRPKWRPEYSEQLRGAMVLVVADNDPAGFAHARAVAAALRGVAAQVRVFRPAVDEPKADMTDHLDAGHGLGDLVPLDPQSPEIDRQNRQNPGPQAAPEGSDSFVGQSPEEWPTPTPLPTLPPLVEFPAAALPDWVCAWVRAEAEATQTPEDLAGTSALCVLAACAGGRVEVEARSGWREPTNLYGLPVMPPGSRKSAVVSAATRPLYAAEEDLAAAVRTEQSEALVTRDIASKAAKVAMEKAAKAAPDKRAAATSDAISAQSAAEGIEVPVTPRLIADDVTPEAVGSLLAAHGGRLAIISAEGGVFDTMNGRYSNGVPSLDVWLKGHSGDVLRVDRKGREAEYVKRPALTLLLTVQPAVLAAVAHNPAFRGRGLVARFLPSVPLDNVGRRRIGADPVPPDVTATYEKRVTELVAELAAWTDPAVLTLTRDAHELLLKLERNVEPRLKPDGEYGPIREWASKLVGATLRIAALLHLAEDGGQRTRMPIEADTLRRASVLGDYFAGHAMRAFGGLTPHDRDHAAELLAWLRQKGPHNPQNPSGGEREAGSVGCVVLSVRDAHYALKRRAWVESADDIRGAFEVLAEHGWVRAVEREPGKPGRPSERYELHPHITHEPAEAAQPQEATRPARPLTEESA